MAEEQRKKTRQLNFRLPPELAERFEVHCNRNDIPMQQFFENAVRKALGEPLTIPPETLGVDSHYSQTELATKGIEAMIEAKLTPVLERLAALEGQQQEKKIRRVA